MNREGIFFIFFGIICRQNLPSDAPTVCACVPNCSFLTKAGVALIMAQLIKGRLKLINLTDPVASLFLWSAFWPERCGPLCILRLDEETDGLQALEQHYPYPEHRAFEWEYAALELEHRALPKW